MKLTFLLLFICIPVLILAQDVRARQDYKIYHTTTQEEIPLEALTGYISEKQVLIFGEQHNDSTGHLVEQALLEKLYERFGSRLVLSMEMFERDVQLVLDEYLSGLIREKNFLDEARAWKNYESYRPLIEFARAKRIPVVAANAPARYVNLATRRSLPALNELRRSARRFIAPLPIDTLQGAYYAKFQETMGEHQMPGMYLYQSQNLWDATMAYSVSQAFKGNRRAVVYHLNGRFHSDEHTGVTARIKETGRTVLTISCFPADDFKSPDWKRYSKLADFVIITR